MQNLLVGNGINIQFSHNDYTTQTIVLRILEELDSKDFPRQIIIDQPILLKGYIGKLFLFARKMIDGAFNDSTICTAEKVALVDFIERYKKRKSSLRITDIGFEDYYLVHDLVCHKYGIHNPEQYNVRESLRMVYLLSIYNHGKINCLYGLYNEGFKRYLSEFNNIFSTNYDGNIESAIGKSVFHIHGQFDKLSEVYNQNSFRNHMHDAPSKNTLINPAYSYLYSTALSTYCGDYKQYLIKQHVLANEAIEKFAKAYLNNAKVHADIDSWDSNSNILIANLADSIKLKVYNPELKFQEDYPIKELSNIYGSLEILGLSPYNDYHLFDIIDHSSIDECKYYYFNKSERRKVETIFPRLNAKGKLKFESTDKFWSRINEKN